MFHTDGERPLPACPAGEVVCRLEDKSHASPRPLPARPAGEVVRRLRSSSNCFTCRTSRQGSPLRNLLQLDQQQGGVPYITWSVTLTGSLKTPLLSVARANSVKVPLVLGEKLKVQTPGLVCVP
jgi:hypothetical protein